MSNCANTNKSNICIALSIKTEHQKIKTTDNIFYDNINITTSITTVNRLTEDSNNDKKRKAIYPAAQQQHRHRVEQYQHQIHQHNLWGQAITLTMVSKVKKRYKGALCEVGPVVLDKQIFNEDNGQISIRNIRIRRHFNYWQRQRTSVFSSTYIH